MREPWSFIDTVDVGVWVVAGALLVPVLPIVLIFYLLGLLARLVLRM